jgi:DNA-binding MarR family transcriptional regulator
VSTAAQGNGSDYYFGFKLVVRYGGPMSRQTKPKQRRSTSWSEPQDSIDRLIVEWGTARSEIDLSPVAVIGRLRRVRFLIDQELEELFQSYGLSNPGFAVLSALARAPGGRLTQRELGAKLGLTAGTVSVRIDRLADLGLVEREPDPGDKRGTIVHLTAAGADRFEACAPAHLANQERLLSSLSREERVTLARLLRKLLLAFEGDTSEGGGTRIGLALSPAHVTAKLRQSVGLEPLNGLLVREVEPDTPAAYAGIRQGDVLVSADGEELRSIATLVQACAGKERVTLRVVRGVDERRLQLRFERKRR